MKKFTTAIAATFMAAGSAFAADQGVTDTEVVIGSVTDLSGPFAAVGVPALNGANMLIDEVNAAGGIHGRQIRYVVEDNGYQIPRAMQGYNKLLNKDKAFAMLMSLGTPMNLAGFKLLDPKGIPNVSPLSGARDMLKEPMENKFIGFASYWDQMQVGVKWLAENKEAKTICSMYIPSDFGKEIADSTKDVSEKLGLTFKAESTHKPDEQDFVGSVTKMKSEGCDVVTVALTVRQGITVAGTAKKLGWTDVTFLTSSAGFLDVVAAVPGGVTDGLMAASGFTSLSSRTDVPVVAEFMEKYEAKFGHPAGGFAMLGYNSARTLIEALKAAGPDLTHESFIKGMESLDYHSELADTQITYGPGDHVGAEVVFVSVVENGKWKALAKIDP